MQEEVLSTPKRSARVQGQGLMTLTPATTTTEIDTTTSELAKLGRMVIEQLQNSGGAICQIQDSMGAVQGSDVTATQNVIMSDSMGEVQGSDVTATQNVSMSDGKKEKNSWLLGKMFESGFPDASGREEG